MKSLVIFYSKTGKTYTVANTIRNILDTHIREVVDNHESLSIHEYLFTSLCNNAIINPEYIDIDYYETIFIGTPIWFGSITPAITKIIENINFKNKNVILFTTQKGYNDEIAMRRLQKLVSKHNGNIKGCFSIVTNCNKNELEKYTYQAIKDLNLTED